MIRLTRQYRFSASHRLHSAALSEEANRAVYGKCNNPFGHGHDYVVQVRVCGPVEEETGLVANIEQLDAFVETWVLAGMRNANLNDLEALATLVPTTENLAAEIHRRLEESWTREFGLPWPRLDAVRVLETRRNFFETTSSSRPSEGRIDGSAPASGKGEGN